MTEFVNGFNHSTTKIMSNKPLPMKLFSTWEVVKTTSSCIPRLCCLTLTRLVIMKPLKNDPQNQSIVIALKMQSAKRVLRSNEIQIPSSGLLDTELDLSFSLQYPHFLKRDCNYLQIFIQRRKKYKNRAMPGYKTLALGKVNMSYVLQHSCDQELKLFPEDAKEGTNHIAKVMMMSLSSQPVDHTNRRQNVSTDVDRSPGEMSDDDDVMMPEEPEDSSNDDTSDVDMMMMTGDDDNPLARKTRKARDRFVIRQRNFKEKFAALLKRFKVTDEVLVSAVQDLGENEMRGGEEIADDMFEDVENVSDSDPDIDALSVRSTPKPKLRPFFSARGGSNTCLDGRRGHDDLFLGGSKLNKYDNEANQPRRVFMDQMSTILSCDHNSPEVIVMVNSLEWHGQLLAQALQSPKHRTICTCSASEVRTVMSTIVSKIQKCVNKSLTQELPIKVAIVGGDKYISSILHPYVELFSNKSPDWINYIRFLVVPLGPSVVGKNLCTMDTRYAGLFNDTSWKDNVFERFDFSNRFNQSMDIGEVATRIVKYLNNAKHMIQMPLAEAILTNKEKGIDDSSHLIVPFLGEVRLGVMDVGTSSNIFSSIIDNDETLNINTSLSNSPPQSCHMISHVANYDKMKDVSYTSHTPPEGNNFSSTPATTPSSASTTNNSNTDSFDLQLDYWLIAAGSTNQPTSNSTSNAPTTLFSSDQKSDILTNLTSSAGSKFLSKKDLKFSLKTMFRSVQIFRNSGLHLSGDGGLIGGQSTSSPSSGLSMVVVTREKKQKIMRIGKRSKESEMNKSQQIDGISRLICTSRSQNHPLNVTIDGVDWMGIKFFQVSSQWQTHIKYFPVLIFGEVPLTANTIP